MTIFKRAARGAAFFMAFASVAGWAGGASAALLVEQHLTGTGSYFGGASFDFEADIDLVATSAHFVGDDEYWLDFTAASGKITFNPSGPSPETKQITGGSGYSYYYYTPGSSLGEPLRLFMNDSHLGISEVLQVVFPSFWAQLVSFQIGGDAYGYGVSQSGPSSYAFGSLTGINAAGQLGANIDVASLVYPQTVPEPATWAAMTLGLGLVGMLARRRRSAVTV